MSIFEYDEERERELIKKAEFECGKEEGIKAGIELGKAQGIELGKAQGIELPPVGRFHAQLLQIALCLWGEFVKQFLCTAVFQLLIINFIYILRLFVCLISLHMYLRTQEN